MNYKNKKSGFVILYAVIVASVVSLSGILLANIIVKQIILSSIGRESQFAYYNANVANECIRHAIKNNQFGDFLEDRDGFSFIPNEDPNFLCQINSDYNPSQPEITPEDYRIFDLRVEPCVLVKVILRPPVGDESASTYLTAKGYNVCGLDNWPDYNHPRLVERVIYRDNSSI